MHVEVRKANDVVIVDLSGKLLMGVGDEILRNVVEHLSGAPEGAVELTLEINAKSTAYDDRVRRVVGENAKQLEARSQEFE